MNSLCCPSFAVRGKRRKKISASQVIRSVIWGGESVDFLKVVRIVFWSGVVRSRFVLTVALRAQKHDLWASLGKVGRSLEKKLFHHSAIEFPCRERMMVIWPLYKSLAMLCAASIAWLRPESCTWSWIDLPTSRAQISSQARSTNGRFFNVFCAKAKSELDRLS